MTDVICDPEDAMSHPTRTAAAVPARRARRLALTAAALAVLSAGATAAPAHAGTAGADFDFAACPALTALPEGADPAAWRCEAMTADARLTLGRIDQPLADAMTITFAEGTDNGEYRQVFGAMTAGPTRVRGTALTITPEYGGRSDFHSDDERRGELDLTFRLGGPGVPPGCSIGTDAEPVRLVLKETVPPRVVTREPLVVGFGVADHAFTAPRTSGCGLLGPVLDAVLGLPSPAGANFLDLEARVAFRAYGETAAGS
ncbi:hypothetical protein [Streptomyces sp. NPDC018693]|uniref:hypothetical protein n=1 Tax=unclassified Streptomyces TaxID=2593676 RepID=UPI0037B048B2